MEGAGLTFQAEVPVNKLGAVIEFLIQQGQPVKEPEPELVTAAPAEKRKYTKGQVIQVSKPTVERIATPATKKGNSKSEMREKIVGFYQKGWSVDEIAEKLSIPKANVYYYIKGVERPNANAGKNSATPTKIGEREIDQDRTIKETDWDEIKEQHNDGMASGLIAMGFQQYESDEISRALKFDAYTDYKKSKKSV